MNGYLTRRASKLSRLLFPSASKCKNTNIPCPTFADTASAIRALVSANLLYNNIGIEQAQNLATIFKEHATLKSLCGNKGDETELDMSGKRIGPAGAIMLAPEIAANGALASLDLSQNEIPPTQLDPIKALCESKQITLKE